MNALAEPFSIAIVVFASAFPLLVITTLADEPVVYPYSNSSQLIDVDSATSSAFGAAVTVTVHVAVNAVPSFVVAVISASPAAFAVTFPSVSTVATFLSEDVQVTFWFASAGVTVAESVAVFPSVKDKVVGVTVMAVALVVVSPAGLKLLPPQKSALIA